MRMPTLLIALILAVSCGLAQAAEPVARVRVAFDRHGETATQAEGLADIAANRAIGIDDPARIASISKLVTAIAVLRLVEAGTLSLDEDVGQRLGVPLRNPAFPGTPISLRMLLSHTSSLTDGAGYWDVPLGTGIEALTADPKAWDTGHAPGSYFRYTNLNFPLVAQVMERATGERFDRLMRRLVLFPLKLDACFNWSGCSDDAVRRAVVLYDAERTPRKDDLHGQRPACLVIAARRQLRPGPVDAGPQRRAVLAAGRAADLGARPRPHRPAAAQRRHARRRAPALAGLGAPARRPGVDLRRRQRRDRRGRRTRARRLLLRLRPGDPGAGQRRRQPLPRRPVRRRPPPHRPQRQCLRPALGPVAGPRRRHRRGLLRHRRAERFDRRAFGV